MFKRLLFLVIGVFSFCVLPAFAGEQGGLQTLDKSCRFYYLTHKNTQGWYISVSPELCKEGVVQGQGEVTIYNAFGKPAEQVYGFFNAGYWTGDKSISAAVVGRTTDPDGTQKVFFTLPNESVLNAQYIGQMTATKQKDGIYGAFSFCNPFRVLVKTQDMTLFQDQSQTTILVDSVAKQVRDFCPAERMILMYAARTERPRPTDIFFYAEIDLQAAHIEVKKNQAFFPSVPVNPVVPVDNLMVPEDPVVPTDMPDFGMAPDLDLIAAGDESPLLPAETEIILVPKQEETVQPDVSNVLDKAVHLLVAGKILRRPVSGTAIVHIKSADGAVAVADKPALLQLRGEGFQEGWGLVSGTFTYQSGTPNLGMNGAVEVVSFVPCVQEMCQELEEKDE